MLFYVLRMCMQAVGQLFAEICKGKDSDICREALGEVVKEVSVFLSVRYQVAHYQTKKTLINIKY
jgi:hypothetical protein